MSDSAGDIFFCLQNDGYINSNEIRTDQSEHGGPPEIFQQRAGISNEGAKLKWLRITVFVFPKSKFPSKLTQNISSDMGLDAFSGLDLSLIVVMKFFK